MHRGFWLLNELSDPRPRMRDHVRGCFDLRISWIVPEPIPRHGENDADAYSAWAFAAVGAEAMRADVRRTQGNQTNVFAVSRSEVEAYAATNEMFGPAMYYFLATIDGRQPTALPAGLSIAQIEDVATKVFPGASNVVDRPIYFYGKVVDESNQPVRGCKASVEWSCVLLPGNSHAEVTTDSAGLFSLTNAMGTHLSVSVDNSNYYASVRNRGNNSFEYVSSFREPFKPDQKNPVIYYLHKKGVGARTWLLPSTESTPVGP